MAAAPPNSFKARKTLKVGSRNYTYFSLKAVEKEVGDLSRFGERERGGEEGDRRNQHS